MEPSRILNCQSSPASAFRHLQGNVSLLCGGGAAPPPASPLTEPWGGFPAGCSLPGLTGQLLSLHLATHGASLCLCRWSGPETQHFKLPLFLNVLPVTPLLFPKLHTPSPTIVDPFGHVGLPLLSSLCLLGLSSPHSLSRHSWAPSAPALAGSCRRKDCRCRPERIPGPGIPAAL